MDFLKSKLFWENEILGNTVSSYVTALLVFICTLVILKVVFLIILPSLKKIADRTKVKFDDLLFQIASKAGSTTFVAISIYFATRFLKLIPIIDKVILVLVLIVIIFFVVRGCMVLIDYFIDRSIKTDSDSVSVSSVKKNIKVVFNAVLWVVGLLFLLSNLGFNINSLITGLGIGGIAIALAVQNVLGDTFNSLVIFLDKPFEVGDYIVVDNFNGTVEHIGLKSTRIASLSGEQIVVSNSHLTGAKIKNYKKMQKRRINFKVGVIYGTSYEKLQSIPKLIKDVIDQQENIEFDRSVFESMGDYSLNFDIVYFVKSREYMDFANVHEKINYAIYKKFEEEGIDFAFPTQTIHLEKS